MLHVMIITNQLKHSYNALHVVGSINMNAEVSTLFYFYIFLNALKIIQMPFILSTVPEILKCHQYW
jgi:hypothetical protein